MKRDGAREFLILFAIAFQAGIGVTLIAMSFIALTQRIGAPVPVVRRRVIPAESPPPPAPDPVEPASL